MYISRAKRRVALRIECIIYILNRNPAYMLHNNAGSVGSEA